MRYDQDSFCPRLLVVSVITGSVFMTIYAIANSSVYFVMALCLYSSVAMKCIFWGISKAIAQSKLVNIDLIYYSTLIYGHVANVAAAALSVVVSKQFSNSTLLFKLCMLWLASAFITTLQRCVLFYLTSITIWKAYLPRIKTIVISHDIVCGFSQFVLKHAPTPQELLRRDKELLTKQKPNRRTNSLFDIEQGQRVLNQRTESAMKREHDFFGSEHVPIHSVHAAVKMQGLDDLTDPAAVMCLYDRVVSALQYGSTDTITPVVRTVTPSDPTVSVSVSATQHNKAVLTRENIQRIFTMNPLLANQAMLLLDKDCNGRINRMEFVSGFVDIYERRQDLHSTISDYENMAAVLDRVLSFITTVLLFFVVLLLFDVNVVQNSVFLLSLFAATSIAFGTTLQQWFEGLVFVFSVRPMDIGDRVFIRDESLVEQNYVVKKITLLSTTFLRSDNITVTVMNSKLKLAYIVNAFRSPYSVHKFPIKLPVDTDLKVIEELKESVKKLDIEHFTSVDVIFTGVRTDGLATDILLVVVQSVNFQDLDLKNRNNNRICHCVHEVLRAHNIPHIHFT